MLVVDYFNRKMVLIDLICKKDNDKMIKKNKKVMNMDIK